MPTPPRPRPQVDPRGPIVDSGTQRRRWTDCDPASSCEPSVDEEHQRAQVEACSLLLRLLAAPALPGAPLPWTRETLLQRRALAHLDPARTSIALALLIRSARVLEHNGQLRLRESPLPAGNPVLGRRAIPTRSTTPAPHVPPVDLGILLLVDQALRRPGPFAGASALARHLRLPLSEVHRALVVLTASTLPTDRPRDRIGSPGTSRGRPRG